MSNTTGLEQFINNILNDKWNVNFLYRFLPIFINVKGSEFKIEFQREAYPDFDSLNYTALFDPETKTEPAEEYWL